MSRDGEGFLNRWARLKAEAATTPAPPAAPAPEPADPAPLPPDPEALTPEEVAALPPVESVATPEGLRAFLRRGVPLALKQAALRRMWTLDPVIRGYVDPALDYAWDFNAPAAAAGWGPLAAGDDAQALARRILSPEPAPPPAEPPQRSAPAEEPPATGPGTPPAPPVSPKVAAVEPDGEPPAAPVPRRRHGGARPA